jgi:hypothetical protein
MENFKQLFEDPLLTCIIHCIIVQSSLIILNHDHYYIVSILDNFDGNLLCYYLCVNVQEDDAL